MKIKLIIAALAFMTLFISSAFAMDAFTEAVEKAYIPYRSSLFATNTKAKMESQRTVQKAQEAWVSIVNQFSSQAPVPYDRDSGFSVTLSEVGKVYAKAADEINDDKLAEAHETLEKVRDLLADLRKRNNIIVYSDHMNEYHAAMEELDIKGKQTLAGEQGIQKLIAQTGVLEYLYLKLVFEAPAQYKKSEEFIGLIKNVEKSVNNLKAALFTQDSKAVIEAMGKLKAPYSKLFLKFG